MSRLKQIEKLEDSINDKLQVILSTSQNADFTYNHPITYDEKVALHEDFRSIESNAKELAKLTAKVIGKLRAYDKLLEGG